MRLSVWLGAGFVTAGVCAGLIVGAAAANAETSPSPEPGGGNASLSSNSDATSSAPGLSTRGAGASGRDTLQTRSQRATGPLRATVTTSINARPADVIGGVVANVGSVAFNALHAAEAVITGPPVVPPNSTVTVKSSTLELNNGQSVPANWYYPKTDNGAPPEHMVLLQHGFLALGPMYSYTAANLADRTHSVVVTPTLSSNPFAGDASWLGGAGMSASIADLFVGDRTELTASAVAAGYASQYGLNPATAQLPQKFALAGHSLGASLVSGAAGALVDNGAADDLVGVILLDGVPVGDTLPIALTKLNDYASKPGGHFVPVREIGAPFNLFNSVTTVNEDLSTARPFRFKGVVLDGGVHMDSMRGGNPLIQFVAYVVAGFPRPENPAAVDELSTTWLDEWFAGDTGIGDSLVPGSTFDVPNSTAHGVVIGASPPNGFARTLQGFLPLLLSLF